MGFMNRTFYLSLLVCLACGCGKSVEDKEAEFSGYRDAAEMKSDSAQRIENRTDFSTHPLTTLKGRQFFSDFASKMDRRFAFRKDGRLTTIAVIARYLKNYEGESFPMLYVAGTVRDPGGEPADFAWIYDVYGASHNLVHTALGDFYLEKCGPSAGNEDVLRTSDVCLKIRPNAAEFSTRRAVNIYSQLSYWQADPFTPADRSAIESHIALFEPSYAGNNGELERR